MAIAKGAQFPITSDLATSIREFILKHFPLARKHQIKNSDHLLESGMLDSMGVLEVVTFIEQEYGFGVSDDDLVPEHFQTIDHIVLFIQSKTIANPTIA
jgi:acyl carrier protein